MEKRRVGLYGGTFNPPHVGHVGAAEAFCREISLDKLIIMPDYLPPHKDIKGDVSASDRLNMARLAFGHIDNAVISDMEIKREGRSYTSVTLEELSSPSEEIYFLCGTDMLLTLSEWYRPEVIFRLATICFVRRENDRDTTLLIEGKIKEYERKYSARIIHIPTDVKVVSSSELRSALENGERLEELLPYRVLDYINEKRLYK